MPYFHIYVRINVTFILDLLKRWIHGLQEDHLSPLIFLLFVNDLDETFKYSKFLQFADDLKLYNPIITHNNCLELLEDTDRFSEWCKM